MGETLTVKGVVLKHFGLKQGTDLGHFYPSKVRCLLPFVLKKGSILEAVGRRVILFVDYA